MSTGSEVRASRKCQGNRRGGGIGQDNGSCIHVVYDVLLKIYLTYLRLFVDSGMNAEHEDLLGITVSCSLFAK